jgi:hypothetical protein
MTLWPEIQNAQLSRLNDGNKQLSNKFLEQRRATAALKKFSPQMLNDSRQDDGSNSGEK